MAGSVSYLAGGKNGERRIIGCRGSNGSPQDCPGAGIPVRVSGMAGGKDSGRFADGRRPCTGPEKCVAAHEGSVVSVDDMAGGKWVSPGVDGLELEPHVAGAKH